MSDNESKDAPPLTIYCPECGAYLLAFDCGDATCDQCGAEFEILPTLKGATR